MHWGMYWGEGGCNAQILPKVNREIIPQNDCAVYSAEGRGDIVPRGTLECTLQNDCAVYSVGGRRELCKKRVSCAMRGEACRGC